MERVPVPSEKETSHAKNKDILNKLNDVDMDVIDNFDAIAEELIKKNNKDSKKALKIALAYCSGYFKGPVLTKSLLTNREDFITI